MDWPHYKNFVSWKQNIMKNIYQKVIGEKIDTYYMDFNLKINDDHIAIMLAV